MGSLPITRIKLVLLALTLAAATTAKPARCVAYYGMWLCPCPCDGTTWCAWKQTWHAYNGLDMPLTAYYLPRTSPCCGYAGCADQSGCAESCACEAEAAGGQQYWPAGEYGVVPPVVGSCPQEKFERLGQIPNEIGISLGAPAPAPTR